MDPTTPIAERTPDQVGQYIDDHLIMALEATESITHDRQHAEDYLRDRLVAISDGYPNHDALASEEARRRLDRLRRAIFLSDQKDS